MRIPKYHPAAIFLAGLLFCGQLAAQHSPSESARPLPTPEQFAGFPIGSDGNLVRWEKIVEYFHLLGAGSDRVFIEELGKSTNGNPFILAILSSPENLQQLAEIKATQRKLAYPYGLSDADASRIANSSPAVVLITGNIHATEIASSQMALELAYRMATEETPWMRNVLDRVVLLLAPSANPDGQVMVTDWNNRVRDTPHVWASLPWLYHPYAGHDNNRDAFMMRLIESRYLNRILFQEWFPQVYLDQHQQGNAGMRAFVPPFRSPINPNVDPVIWAQAGLFGFAMFSALHQAGYSGITYDQKYTAWWQGGFLRSAWFHNIVGILTEIASANLASPAYQQEAALGEPPKASISRQEWYKKRVKNPTVPSPPPTDVMPRYNYPRPWLGGKWTLRDIVDYELVLTEVLLETAANQRVRLITNQIEMGKAAMTKGTQQEPFAYVIAAEQRDPWAAYELLEALHFTGIEIHQAVNPFVADGEQHAAGAFVILMSQPFRAYAKDLLERQKHPDPGQMPEGSMDDQPYDITAWTLPLQLGVEAVPVNDNFQTTLVRLAPIPKPRGKLGASNGQAAGFVISPKPNNIALAANRLLAARAEVFWLADPVQAEGRSYPAGSLWISNSGAAVKLEVASIVREWGLRGAALREMPAVALHRLRPARVALYQPWTASIDEGWTRWLLERYEFAFTSVHNNDLQQQHLADRWDAIILPGDQNEARLLKGNEWESESMPPEFRGGLGKKGRGALREFVAGGGTLIALGASTEAALAWFALPIRDGLKGVARAQFSCPGSLLRILVDPHHPVAYGMPSEATAVFKDSTAFELAPGFSFTGVKTIARYPNSELLQSGWMRGPEHLYDRIAAAEVEYKKGRVVLIGFQPQFRAQSGNTFKLLFNAIFSSSAEK